MDPARGYAKAQERIQQALRLNLSVLDLAELGLTTLPPEIGKLSQLTSLNLSHNQLATLPPEIGQLSQLTSLYLTNNQLTNLPQEIGKLSQLTVLVLSHNQLATLPPEIGKLSQLTALDLSRNQLTTLPPEIGKLSQLTVLVLSNNQLTTLPPEIGQLSQLTELYLRDNQLTTLPSEIGKLSQLTYLHLAYNRLANLPPDLKHLHSLHELDLANNQLTEIPAELATLHKLRKLDLRENALTTIPPDLLRIKNLYLSRNPFSSLPREVVKQGEEGIKSYLKSGNRTRPSRCKLIFVGGAEFGKTSLRRALKGETVTKGELSQTHGIEIQTLSLPHPQDPARTMRLNAWDFGGQIIYHATHQFFLSDHALFVLVWSARRGVLQAQHHYWLDMIRSRAPHAKVIIVATHLDEAGSVDFDFHQLLQQYPDILHPHYFAVSCTERTNIESLLETMRRIAAKVRAMDYEWPDTWLNASRQLLARAEDLLPLADVRSFLKNHRMPDETEQDTLLNWLHELGDIVWYPQVDELHDLVFLKPEWITHKVAAILDDQEVKDAKGVLTPQHLERLWSDVEPKLRRILTILMDHYDLTYVTEVQNERIVVECLQHKPTAYQERWEARNHQRSIRVRYHFNPRFQPGIPTWFIARGHRYSTGHQWRNGVLFEDREYESACLMEADPDRASVALTVRGPNPAYFFGVMLRTFSDTLSRYPGLDYTRYLPCPCGGKKGETACAHEFNFADVVDAYAEPDAAPGLQCPKSRKVAAIPKILNGTYVDSHQEIIDMLVRLIQGQKELGEEIRASFAQLQNQFTLDLVRKQNELDMDAPGVFTLHHPNFRMLPTTLEAWKRALLDLEADELELCIYCEHPGEWHLTPHSLYRFRPTADWVQYVMPYWSPVQKVLKTCSPILKATAKAKFPFLEDAFSRGLESAAEASAAITADRLGQLSAELGRHQSPLQLWEQARVQLRALIEDLDARRKDPATRWGGLRRTHTPSGEILWLCPTHKAKTFPKTSPGQ